MQNAAVPLMTREVWDALGGYHFPGNVRELENALVRGVALSTGKIITLDCLPAAISEASRNKKECPTDAETLRELAGDRPPMEELQRRYLSLILTEVGGNRRRAAEKLGLDRRTIQRLIAKYNLFAQPDEETDETDIELNASE